jgi:hypothetical protein
MNSFEYAAPKTLKEAISLLSDTWGKTEVLAEERSGLTLTFVIDTSFPCAISGPFFSRISASSFWISRDTFFCLVDSMA